VQTKGFCRLLWEALQDFLLQVLIVAAIVSIVLQVVFDEDHRSTAWIEGFAIIIAVAVISLVTAFNNYEKEQQFKKLN
jgi:magnesium-transporting ATPase (P-type)